MFGRSGNSLQSAQNRIRPELALPAPREAGIVAVNRFDHASSLALLRAAAWARIFDSQLYVLYISPKELHLDGLQFQDPDEQDAGQASRRDVQDWIASVLGRPLPEDRVLIGEGNPDEQIVAAAQKVCATHVILASPGKPHTAASEWSYVRRARRIARRLGKPTLVARAPALSKHILAASDGTDSAYPVLHLASAIGCRMEADVTFLHNVNPWKCAGAFFQGFVPSFPLYDLDPPWHSVDSAQAQLRSLADRYGDQIQTVVCHDPDVVPAILGQAVAHQSDLIMVGVHATQDLPWWAGSQVASRIALSAPCSVLLVPLMQTSQAPDRQANHIPARAPDSPW